MTKKETPLAIAQAESVNSDTPNLEDIGKLESEHASEVAAETPTPDSIDSAPRKRGRPKGSKNRAGGTPAVSQKSTDDIKSLIPRPVAKAILAAPYALVANRYGEHWMLTDVEVEALIDPHLSLAAKYLPDYLKSNPELYACLLLHGMIVFSKMEMHYRLKNEEAERAKLANTGQTPVKDNAKDNPVPRKDGLREELSGFGLHKDGT